MFQFNKNYLAEYALNIDVPECNTRVERILQKYPTAPTIIERPPIADILLSHTVNGPVDDISIITIYATFVDLCERFMFVRKSPLLNPLFPIECVISSILLASHSLKHEQLDEIIDPEFKDEFEAIVDGYSIENDDSNGKRTRAIIANVYNRRRTIIQAMSEVWNSDYQTITDPYEYAQIFDTTSTTRVREISPESLILNVFRAFEIRVALALALLDAGDQWMHGTESSITTDDLRSRASRIMIESYDPLLSKYIVINPKPRCQAHLDTDVHKKQRYWQSRWTELRGSLC